MHPVFIQTGSKTSMFTAPDVSICSTYNGNYYNTAQQVAVLTLQDDTKIIETLGDYLRSEYYVQDNTNTIGIFYEEAGIVKSIQIPTLVTPEVDLIVPHGIPMYILGSANIIIGSVIRYSNHLEVDLHARPDETFILPRLDNTISSNVLESLDIGIVSQPSQSEDSNEVIQLYDKNNKIHSNYKF